MDRKTRYRVSSRWKVCCRVLWLPGSAVTNNRRREIPPGKSRDTIWHIQSQLRNGLFNEINQVLHHPARFILRD